MKAKHSLVFGVSLLVLLGRRGHVRNRTRAKQATAEELDVAVSKREATRNSSKASSRCHSLC